MSASTAKPWHEIKLFISSTFRDMQAERDYLVRFVFPRIRENLLRHHIYFTDVDLRWGITDESNICGVCRSIIDECHPLFLGILGGRYGFIPDNSDLSVSVTEDEMTYAISSIKKSGYDRMLFMLRNEQDTLSMRESVPGEFREPAGSESERKLSLLKQRILKSDLDVCEYRAVWNESLGALTGLYEFGEKVYQYVMALAEKAFDLAVESEHSDNTEDAELEIYIAERNKYYIESGLERSFQALSDAVHAKKENNAVLVEGRGGIGKSAFLCRFIQRAREEGGTVVLPLFVGVTPNSQELSGLLFSLCGKLLAHSSYAEPVPMELDRLILYFQTLLLHLNRHRRYVLIIDGINQIQPDNNALELNWLPRQLPNNICLVLSSATEKVSETVRNRWSSLVDITLPGLNSSASRQMIEYYLGRYQKRLSETQMDILLSKNCAFVPLYLTTIIEEIRLYGQYDQLTSFISELPGGTISLLEWIIRNRLASSREFTDLNGQDISADLTRRFLSYLYISDRGLSEKELYEILSEYNSNGNVAALTRQLRPFLSLRGDLLGFYHDDIKKAIFHVYIEHADIPSLHAELTRYFMSKADPHGDFSFCSNSLRDFRQLLFHTLYADNWNYVVSLIQHGFFEAYTVMETAEHTFRSINSIANYFANLSSDSLSQSDEQTIWSAGLRALQIYDKTAAAVAETDADQPHPIERAIAEGRDDDVETLISAANEAGQAYLRTAAAALYRSAGREVAAKAIEQVDSEKYSYLFRPEQIAFFKALFTPDEPEKEAKEEKKKENNSEKKQEKKKNPVESVKNTTERRTKTRKKKISPRIRIPALQYLMLTLTGANRCLYLILFFSIALVLVWFSPLNLIMWTDRLYALMKDFFLVSVTDFILKGISGAIMLAFVGGVIFIIGAFSHDYVQKRSSDQLKAMAIYAGKASDKKLTRTFLRILRYIRLLDEAEQLNVFPAETEEALITHIRKCLKDQRFVDAGKLLSCMAVSGMCDNSIIKVLSDQTDKDKKVALLGMLSERSVLSQMKITRLIDIVYTLYGPVPPPAVLYAVISWTGKDESVVEALRKFDQSVIASCLLRSKIPESTMNRKFVKLRRKFAKLFQKHANYRFTLTKLYNRIKSPFTYILVEPVSLEWYNLLIRFCLILIPVLFIIIVLCFIGIMILHLLFMFGIAVLCLCIIIEVWSPWNEFNKSKLVYKYNDRFKVSDEALVSGKYDFLRMTTAVETALSGNLAADPFSAKEVLSHSEHQNNKILISAIRLSKKRRQLLPAMLEPCISPGETLQVLLRDNRRTERRGKPQITKSLKNQWSSVKPRRIDILSTIAMGILSAAICAGILYCLYLLNDPWLQLMIDKMRWYLLGASFICALIRKLMIPLPIITFFVLGILYADKGLLEPNFGAFIFYVIPACSILLSHIMVQKFRGRKLLFPAAIQSALEKLKSVLFGAAGIIVTVALIFVLLIGDALVKGVSANPGKDVYAALQSYSAARLLPDSFPDPGKGDLIMRFNTFFSGKTEYQYNIFTRVKESNNLLAAAYALNNFNYKEQADECRKKASEYAGWADINPDDLKQEIPTALIVLEIIKDSEAVRIGLQEGDAIVAVEGKQIMSMDNLTGALAVNTGVLEITVNRNGKDMNFRVITQILGVKLLPFPMELIEKLKNAVY